MTRWRIDLAYDGTDFSGWARQPGLRTVQGTCEDWIGQVLRLREPVTLTVAGRTDAGVHASAQVAHVDLPDDLVVDDRGGARPLEQVLTHRLRRVLPDDVVVHAVSPAPPGFDARFSAIWRRYCYRIWDAASVPVPTLRRRVVTVRGELDLAALNRGASQLLGLRDFAAFCRPREGATTIRDLHRFEAARTDDGTVEVTVVADAFCHSMVRSLVGAVTAVAQGRRPTGWIDQVAASPVRHGEVLVMPAHGLTLEQVGYPADDQLAERATAARARRDEQEPV
ncbi:tRNA pseudouridine(38-40) synthase TruA [Aestuariimicrobium ganziense]|uniref:tRNA pseudouridine(38-40) synthase TruA n=1 Tax=Aestuariimicrobium ganziense TaxID=2773677 RepID=UPI00194072E8|nr:tRNA pseudouridine(38-40) synthase TruA [Aestuariimicrobium ganziense]